jgi:hypothetical protein
VSASDRDEGANGRVRYSIASGDDNRDFTISEDGGVIRVAKNLNYERKPRYRLRVQAEDWAQELGGQSRADAAEVVIGLLDINDNAPVFLDSPYLAHVMENMLPPSAGFVMQVSRHWATDLNSGFYDLPRTPRALPHTLSLLMAAIGKNETRRLPKTPRLNPIYRSLLASRLRPASGARVKGEGEGGIRRTLQQ